MKKLSFAASILTTLSAFFVGCIQDEKARPTPTDNAVKFSTTIVSTRAYNNMWEAGDRIGVYMAASGAAASGMSSSATPSGTLSLPDWDEVSEAVLAANKLYVHDLEQGEERNSAVFAGVDEQNTISWPSSGEAVDFVAYYPYLPSEKIVDFIYPVDISDQSSPQEIDLMYSDNVRGAWGGNPALDFEHKLAKVIFKVKDLDDVSLEGMTTTLEGLPSTADFDLNTGTMTPDAGGPKAPFQALLVSTADAEAGDGDNDAVKESAQVEAIVIPGAADYTVTFTIAEGKQAVFKIEGANYKAGMRYTYNISTKMGVLGFGDADGDLSSITDWEDDNEGLGTITGDGEGSGDGGTGPGDGGTDPGDGETGPQWSSGTLVDDSADYSAAGDFRYEEGDGFVLASGKNVTITKSNYTGGIASVTLNFNTVGMPNATVSVKVGDVNLLSRDNGTAELTVNSAFNDRDVVFETSDGEPLSGDVEISVVAGTFMGETTKILVKSFSIN